MTLLSIEWATSEGGILPSIDKMNRKNSWKKLENGCKVDLKGVFTGLVVESGERVIYSILRKFCMVQAPGSAALSTL